MRSNTPQDMRDELVVLIADYKASDDVRLSAWIAEQEVALLSYTDSSYAYRLARYRKEFVELIDRWKCSDDSRFREWAVRNEEYLLDVPDCFVDAGSKYDMALSFNGIIEIIDRLKIGSDSASRELAAKAEQDLCDLSPDLANETLNALIGQEISLDPAFVREI